MSALSDQLRALKAVVDRVEAELAQFYGFEPLCRAAEHLIDLDELRAAMGDRVTNLPEFSARAAVFLSADTRAQELFIGIHFSDSISSTLTIADPLTRLADENLDQFCVIVEEVSHFHLILNRMAHEQNVSKLELESQGEIDKLLVAALTLARQCGDSHILPLARRLYDQAEIVGGDRELYWQATKHAARFWFAELRRSNMIGPELRVTLRDQYYAPSSLKIRAS